MVAAVLRVAFAHRPLRVYWRLLDRAWFELRWRLT
jgi:hypothetical protein